MKNQDSPYTIPMIVAAAIVGASFFNFFATGNILSGGLIFIGVFALILTGIGEILFYRRKDGRPTLDMDSVHPRSARNRRISLFGGGESRSTVAFFDNQTGEILRVPIDLVVKTVIKDGYDHPHYCLSTQLAPNRIMRKFVSKEEWDSFRLPEG